MFAHTFFYYFTILFQRFLVVETSFALPILDFKPSPVFFFYWCYSHSSKPDYVGQG